LKPAELKMAQQLIDQMTSTWKPERFKDDFTSAIHALVQKKAEAGDKATVEPYEDPCGPSMSGLFERRLRLEFDELALPGTLDLGATFRAGTP